VQHCNISGNNATNNFYGIRLDDSNNNTLTNNTAANNDYHGICLEDSSNNNTLRDNTANGNTFFGIYLSSSSDNTLISNTATNNSCGIRLGSSSNNTLTSNTCLNHSHGIVLLSSCNNTLTDNTANWNNEDGIYLWGSSSNTFTNNTASNNSWYGICLEDSSNNNTLRDNTANGNTFFGIYLSSSSDNTLISNNANSNNYHGIKLDSSSDNIIYNNTVNWNNDWYGIYLYKSSNNTIYNNYLNNTNNAYDDRTNTWNTTKTNGPNIVGGPYIGGNYWSDYSGSDTNGDGFGDIPYNIPGGANRDYLPLTTPAPPTLTVNVTPAGKGDVNISGVIPSAYPNTTSWSFGENVTLEAVNSTPGWGFVNWSGDLCGNTTPINITMDSDKEVTVNFEEIPPVTYNVTVSIEPSTTYVLPNSSFSIDAVVNNPSGMPISGVATRLDFDNTYFGVTSITPGTTLPIILLNQYDNVAGTIDYDAGAPLGTNTTSASILVCTINCTAKALEGVSTVDWVYTWGPPPRLTKVVYAGIDYLESGNMNLMFSGTVIIGSPKLTVDVSPALKGDVEIDGVAPGSYPDVSSWSWDENVTLEAVNSMPGWKFVNWIGDLCGSTNPTTITMDALTKNVTANFVELPPEIGLSATCLSFAANRGMNPADEMLDIWNSGGGTLNWSVGDDAPWLSESPTSGSLSAGQHDYVTVSVNTSGMEVGWYSANITIIGSANVTIPVTLEIKAAIDVVRNLPDVTYPGNTFDVYVNFTAPVDDFNAIGLIDLAPDGWEVAVDTTWCTPNADAVLATDNKAEIAWFGEPGVGFDNGTPFTAVYKVTVPDDAELGINEFPLDDCSKAWLGYYVGPLGPYASCVIGEHEMTVTTTIDVMRDLPADALDFDAEYPGDTFDVYVNFTAPVDDFNSIGLTDYAPAGWEVETNKTWCDPVADWTMHPYNKAEYAWDGPFGEGQNFTARYKVTIPATAIPGSSYWPDCTPLPYPPWEGSPINNYAVWLEYWFGADGPYESCITGEREKIVTVPGCVVGETRDVNGDMLMIPLDTVTVDLWEDLPTDVWEDQDSSTIVGNVTQYQNCANDTGMYYQTASHYCYYPVNSSAMPGTRNPNYPLLINWSTPELLAAGFTMDFVGDYGLVCKAATMSYAMESVNHWLYTPVDKYGTPQPDWQLSSWKVSQVVHSWQFPCGCRCSGDKPIW